MQEAKKEEVLEEVLEEFRKRVPGRSDRRFRKRS